MSASGNNANIFHTYAEPGYSGDSNSDGCTCHTLNAVLNYKSILQLTTGGFGPATYTKGVWHAPEANNRIIVHFGGNENDTYMLGTLSCYFNEIERTYYEASTAQEPDETIVASAAQALKDAFK